REPPLPQQYSRLQKLLAVPPQRPDGNIRQSDVAPAGPGLCRLETDAPFFLLFALHGRRVGQALAPKAPWSRLLFSSLPGNGFGNDYSNSATDDRRITEAEFVLVVAWWTIVSPGRTIVGRRTIVRRRTIVGRRTIVRRRAVVSSGWTIVSRGRPVEPRTGCAAKAVAQVVGVRWCCRRQRSDQAYADQKLFHEDLSPIWCGMHPERHPLPPSCITTITC